MNKKQIRSGCESYRCDKDLDDKIKKNPEKANSNPAIAVRLFKKTIQYSRDKSKNINENKVTYIFELKFCLPYASESCMESYNIRVYDYIKFCLFGKN